MLGYGGLSRAVFFNLFVVAEHYMPSKKLAEPKMPTKKIGGTPTFSK